MINLSSYAIIFDGKQRVLLCHRRDYDLWNLPGGSVNEHESPWDAAIREAREEVGLTVDIQRLSGVYWKPDREELAFAFVCTIRSGKPTLSDEAERIEYYSLNNLPRNMSPKQVQRVKDAADAAAKGYYREQTGPSSIELLEQGILK